MAAHDVYYLEENDRKARNTLVAINNTSDFADRENDESNCSYASDKAKNFIYNEWGGIMCSLDDLIKRDKQ